MGHRSPLAQLLCSGDREKLCRKNGNGIQVQYNKFLFADKNWQDFSQLDQNMMKLFDFVYVRPDLHAVFRGMNKSEVDPHLRDVEKHAIKRLCPSCNSARPVGSISNLYISFDEIIEEIETLLTGQIKILHEQMKIVFKL